MAIDETYLLEKLETVDDLLESINSSVINIYQAVSGDASEVILPSESELSLALDVDDTGTQDQVVLDSEGSDETVETTSTVYYSLSDDAQIVGDFYFLGLVIAGLLVLNLGVNLFSLLRAR